MFGASPLHSAAEAGHVQVVESLLAHSAVLTTTTTSNLTPLHAAAAAGHAECIHLLLEHQRQLEAGGDPAVVEVLSQVNTLDQTPLHLAAAGGHYAATEVLLMHTPEGLLPSSLEQMDLFARTPLRAALRAASRIGKRAHAAARAAGNAAGGATSAADAAAVPMDTPADDGTMEAGGDVFTGLETALLLLRYGAAAVTDNTTSATTALPVPAPACTNLLDFALDREQPWAPTQRAAIVDVLLAAGWDLAATTEQLASICSKPALDPLLGAHPWDAHGLGHLFGGGHPDDHEQLLDRSIVSERSFIAPMLQRARDPTKVKTLQEICRGQIRATLAGVGGADRGAWGVDAGAGLPASIKALPIDEASMSFLAYDVPLLPEDQDRESGTDVEP